MTHVWVVYEYDNCPLAVFTTEEAAQLFAEREPDNAIVGGLP